MDSALDQNFVIALFLVATFAAAVVAGLAGFAFGLVAAAVWLYILTPLATATLIIAFGLIVQGYAVWKLRHAVVWGRIGPLVLGAAWTLEWMILPQMVAAAAAPLARCTAMIGDMQVNRPGSAPAVPSD